MSPTLPLVFVAVSVVLSGCTDAVALRNARPRVSWLASEPVPPGDPRCPDSVCASLTFWVADPEGDAVDVVAAWTAGTERGDLTLAPASYPLVGVPTRLAQTDNRGAPHTILWLLDEVPTGDLVIELTVDDTPHKGDDGDVYLTPPLNPAARVDPVALELQP